MVISNVFMRGCDSSSDNNAREFDEMIGSIDSKKDKKDRAPHIVCSWPEKGGGATAGH